MSPLSSLTRLRQLTLLEGTSFLVLLFVAMPLKYFVGMPLAVKYVGWAHGVLFMAVIIALTIAMIVARLSLGRAALIFLSTLVPFGPFLLDRRMKNYAGETATRARN